MKIGLYFGTFNPIHIGHLIIANHMAEHSDLDQIWFVVTPQSPFKVKASMLNNHDRLEMVYRATEDYDKLRPSDIEFGLPQPNYTINTLTYLQEKYPQYEFALIMGEDNLKSLHKWKNYELILENQNIYGCISHYKRRTFSDSISFMDIKFSYDCIHSETGIV